MGRVLRFSRDERREAHRRAQELLPWFATGTLGAAEQAELEAHVAGCAECQADLRFERRLRAEVAELPVDADAGWAQMRDRLERGDRPWARARQLAGSAAPWLGWAAAATLAVAVMAPMLDPRPAPGVYRTLSAADAPPVADAVVMFRPDTLERDLRATLTAAGARVVDGPTETGGYLVRLAPEDRADALARLARDPHVVLAQALGPRSGR